jgi:hypothetical protein
MPGLAHQMTNHTSMEEGGSLKDLIERLSNLEERQVKSKFFTLV